MKIKIMAYQTPGDSAIAIGELTVNSPQDGFRKLRQYINPEKTGFELQQDDSMFGGHWVNPENGVCIGLGEF